MIFKRAIELLKTVIEREWDIRFNQIGLTAIMDMNRIFSLSEHNSVKKVRYPLDSRFIMPFEVDIRVTLSWDLDNTDVDLYVEEPQTYGEICFSFNNRTKIGGLLTKDFTNGYGPEEYLLKKAPRGTFKVLAKLNTEQVKNCIVCIRIYTNFGRPQLEKEKVVVKMIEFTQNPIEVTSFQF